MLKRINPASYRPRRFHLLLLAIGLIAAAAYVLRLDRLPSLEQMGIGPPPDRGAAVEQGAAWKPESVGPDGFARVAGNDRFVLFANPTTSQIALEDKVSGFLWRSNPAEADVAKESASGTVLENLQSPYVLEYVSGTNPRRIQTNALDPKAAAVYTLIEDGIQVTYDYGEIGLSFVLQYRLTDAGFEAAVPDAGVREQGEARLFALQLLPYFGAVSGIEERGYLFVPDGPGGLIRYDGDRPASAKGYEFAIYGSDPSHLKDGFREPRREPIAYPVFGLVRGDRAYAAIVKDGKYNASIKALPSGLATSYHSIGAVFGYREEYGRKVSGLSGDTVKAVEEDRVRMDRSVEYRLLSGDEADYVGMAHAYRKYLEEAGMLPEPLQPVPHVPLQLSVIGGGTKPRFGGSGYEAATTFEQAARIVEQLKAEGVENLRVVYQGWQNSGRRDTDRRLPIVKELGGTAGAKRFVASMRDIGVPVWFEDFIGWKNPEYSDFTMKSDGIRSIDSTVLQGRFRFNDDFSIIPGLLGDFIVHPVQAIRKQKEVVDTMEAIGADGIHYVDGPGNLLFSDYNPAARLSREDTAFYYRSLLEYTRDRLGNAGVYRGNDYSLAYAGLVESLPSESSYDFVVDETVPFYPIAVHGAVAYTTKPGNLRDVDDADFLRAIEYGAVPSFAVTHAPSRALMDTDYDHVYSGEFAVWKDRIAKEYAAFDRLSAVYHQRIVDHERVAEGVYATTYEDGTRVVVDYNAVRFEVEGGGAE